MAGDDPTELKYPLVVNSTTSSPSKNPSARVGFHPRAENPAPATLTQRGLLILLLVSAAARQPAQQRCSYALSINYYFIPSPFSYKKAATSIPSRPFSPQSQRWLSSAGNGGRATEGLRTPRLLSPAGCSRCRSFGLHGVSSTQQ